MPESIYEDIKGSPLPSVQTRKRDSAKLCLILSVDSCGPSVQRQTIRPKPKVVRSTSEYQQVKAKPIDAINV